MNPAKTTLKLTAITALVLSLTLTFFQVDLGTAQVTHNVNIFGFAFNPQNVTCQVGDAISWLNSDPVIHTLWFTHVENKTTYKGAGTEGLSNPIFPGGSWSWIFDEQVTLQYFSFHHLWVTGFITVETGVHDVAVTDVTPQKTIVGQGYSMKINVTTENQGGFPATFNVTAYANTSEIDSVELTLASGTSFTTVITWDTTGITKGSYQISANATILPSETDTADNSLIDGAVFVSIPGDVNGDRKCDLVDIFQLILHFGCEKPQPCYVPNYDINDDGKIDMQDIFIAILHYGEEW
jgi:plastocyanin